jgi:hypothetical protein
MSSFSLHQRLHSPSGSTPFSPPTACSLLADEAVPPPPRCTNLVAAHRRSPTPPPKSFHTLDFLAGAAPCRQPPTLTRPRVSQLALIHHSVQCHCCGRLPPPPESDSSTRRVTWSSLRRVKRKSFR